MSGRIDLISIGPGNNEWLPPAVLNAMGTMDVFIGYKTYLQQIETLFPAIPREFSNMRQERERAERAVELAVSGKKVGVISGGDSGIYGMNGLILEMLSAKQIDSIDVEILPGISALNAAASLLGAPLMTDFAVVSLSDYLVPLQTILSRVEAAISGGFVLCLYNPKSHVRTLPFEKTLEILQKSLPAETIVGIVRNAFRPNEQTWSVQLSELGSQEIDMNCILIVGSRDTRRIGKWMVTARGYLLDREDKDENR